MDERKEMLSSRNMPARTLPLPQFMAVDPNRFAAQAEAAILRANLVQDEEDLARVERRIGTQRTIVHNAAQTLQEAQNTFSSAQAILSHLDSQSASLMERIHHARGLMHPIRRLPSDILGEIFTSMNEMRWGANGNDQSVLAQSPPDDAIGIPFTLAAVSKGWRHVALGCPRLWSKIYLNIEEARQGGSASLKSILAHCRLMSARSKAHLVDLAVELPFTDDGAETTGLYSKFSSVFTALLPRCQKIVISTNVDSSRFEDLAFIQQLLAHHQCDWLESFVFRTEGDPRTTYLPFFTTGSRLRYFLLWSFDVHWPVAGLATVQSAKFVDQQLTFERWGTALNSMPNLESLYIGASIDQSSTPPTSFVRSDSLRECTISVDFDELYGPWFRFPALERCTLDNGVGGYYRAFVADSLCHSRHLVSLSVDSVDHLGQDFAQALERLSSLEELSIRRSSLNTEFFLALSNGTTSSNYPYPRLRSLTLFSPEWWSGHDAPTEDDGRRMSDDILAFIKKRTRPENIKRGQNLVDVHVERDPRFLRTSQAEFQASIERLVEEGRTAPQPAAI